MIWGNTITPDSFGKLAGQNLARTVKYAKLWYQSGCGRRRVVTLQSFFVPPFVAAVAIALAEYLPKGPPLLPGVRARVRFFSTDVQSLKHVP